MKFIYVCIYVCKCVNVYTCKDEILLAILFSGVRNSKRVIKYAVILRLYIMAMSNFLLNFINIFCFGFKDENANKMDTSEPVVNDQA